METIAVMVKLDRRTTHFLEREDLGGLEALAQSGIFASRDPEWLHEAPDTRAINAVTYVDKFDKRASGFWGHYDRRRALATNIAGA